MGDEKKQGRADDVHSQSIRAGKRTYFFDVKSTRANDLYLTITESKKKFKDNGKSYFEKHKIFLYKEDFEKFKTGFETALEKIKELQQTDEYQSDDDHSGSSSSEDFSDVAFEDLN